MLKTLLKAFLLSSLLVAPLTWGIEPEPAASDDKAKDASPPEAKAVAEAPPRINLITNGEPPRALARILLKVGDEQSVVMDMGMQMQMAMDGVERPAPPMPTFGINMRLAVEEALPDGRWKYRCEIASLDVKSTEETPADLLTTMKAVMSEMVGIKIGAEVDELGHQRNFEIVSKNTNPMLVQQLETMKQSMAQMSVALPEEEIGVGAKWETESVLRLGGISTRQRATYRLIARAGDSITLGISMTQSPAEKNVPIQNLPVGVSGTLVDLAGSGSGEVVFELTKLMPLRGRVSGESVVNMNMESQGMKMRIDTHTVMVMGIRPATSADETPVQPKP